MSCSRTKSGWFKTSCIDIKEPTEHYVCIPACTCVLFCVKYDMTWYSFGAGCMHVVLLQVRAQLDSICSVFSTVCCRPSSMMSSSAGVRGLSPAKVSDSQDMSRLQGSAATGARASGSVGRYMMPQRWKLSCKMWFCHTWHRYLFLKHKNLQHMYCNRQHAELVIWRSLWWAQLDTPIFSGGLCNLYAFNFHADVVFRLLYCRVIVCSEPS